MEVLFFAKQFEVFCAAQYGAASPDDLPDKQRLEAEDAFFAGALAGFHHGADGDFEQLFFANAELSDFGKRIVQRYVDAGLPTGRRPS